MGLKYLFLARYSDGSRFQQNATDQSLKDTSRSAFFDVDKSRLVSFQLLGEGRKAEVDLRTGQLQADDQVVFPPLVGQSGFELVYFRRHTISRVIGAVEPETHEVAYHLGWTHPHLGSQEVVLQ